MLKLFFGVSLIILGTLDGIKYYWFGQKIIKANSSKSYSRKGLNFAILNDIIRILYGIYILDWYIILSSLFASVTMIYCWWQIYLYYPYRYRNLLNFKRPGILLYTINSILPNKIRRRL